MTSGGSGAGILKIQYIRGRYIPPNNVMPGVSGEYVVSDLSCVTFTFIGKTTKMYVFAVLDTEKVPEASYFVP